MKTKKKLELTNWDWETLVASWRYYENRCTITSSMFPCAMVKRFFTGKYSDYAMRKIARQFAEVDHDIRGEEDWTAEWRNLSGCDIIPWVKFYRFCEGFCKGFKTVTAVTTEGTRKGMSVTIKAFHVDYNDRWYDVDGYMSNPHIESYIPNDWIKEVR